MGHVVRGEVKDRDEEKDIGTEPRWRGDVSLMTKNLCGSSSTRERFMPIHPCN